MAKYVYGPGKLNRTRCRRRREGLGVPFLYVDQGAFTKSCRRCYPLLFVSRSCDPSRDGIASHGIARHAGSILEVDVDSFRIHSSPSGVFFSFFSSTYHY
jgi:hypothetical protein